MDDPTRYGHMPILRAVAALDPRVVVEFGAGLASTPLWLDREAFPRLDALIAYENDAVWADRVRAACGSDARLDLVVGDLRGVIRREALRGGSRGLPDVAFVDNDLWPFRNAILLARLAPIYVLHDAENAVYYAAMETFAHRAIVAPLGYPATAVLSDDPLPDRLARALDDLGAVPSLAPS